MNLKLKCYLCGTEINYSPSRIFCPRCLQPGLVSYSDLKIKTIKENFSLSLEKFLEFLPLDKVSPELSLAEGQTPLLPLNKLDKNNLLYGKLEISNPTLSFKDRGSVIVTHKALELGLKRVGTVSTGNMASSTVAYAARAGLEAILLFKKGSSAGAINYSAAFNPLIIEIEGDYGQLFYQSYELGDKYGIYFANSVDPLRIEGYKLTSFEICCQLGQAPEFVYVPVSSGGHLIGLYKGFMEFKQAGLIKALPIFIGVQAKACPPIVKAFEEDKEKVNTIEPRETIAHSISNPSPPAGNLILKLIRKNQGFLTSVSDQEMLEAQKLLAATEGIFVQPESAASLAAYLKLKDRFTGTSVLILTGHGLKASEQLSRDQKRHYQVTLNELPDIFKQIYE